MPAKKKESVLRDAALEYASAGMPVVPLHSINDKGKCTCGKKCPTPGKHPRTKRGLKDATTDAERIKHWWSDSRWPNASIGGVGGTFLCLDIDVKSHGLESLEVLIADNAPLPDTAVAETGEHNGERGRHYWFRMEEDERVASRAGIRPGIDIRCYNGYAVMPPSPHASGVIYEWVGGIGIEGAVLRPDFLIELVPEYVEGGAAWAPNPHFKMAAEVRDFLRGNYEVEVGEQRQFLCRAARSVLTTGKSVEATAKLLFEGYRSEGGISTCPQNEDAPWQDDEVLALVEDEYAKGPNTPLEKEFTEDEIYQTDIGNAHRLIASYEEGHVFHVAEWDKWYLWNDRRFHEDRGGTLRRRFENVTKEMVTEAIQAQDEQEAKRLFQHSMRSQQKPRVDAAVSLAKDLVAVPIPELNADPMLLNVQNGVVDLRTGELLDPDPSFLLTKQARVEYDENAKASVFEKFLREVIPDKELRSFLQKAFGYTLTGSIDEHKFFYLHGPPASGKSTLLEAFSFLLGNYSESSDPTTFMRNPNRVAQGPTEDLARLANARLVVTHEIEEGMRFAEGHISKLTGGDLVTARFLHQHTFAFRPEFKLWFAANHKPRVSGSSRSGIWRRILILPMEQTIPEDDRDPTIPHRLRQPEVLSGMLNWAIEGCQEWLEDNEDGRLMDVPGAVRGEVEEYRLEADHIASFLDEAINATGEDDDRIPKRDMFESYRGWCEREGRRNVVTSNMLSRRMQDLGYHWKQALHDGKRPDCWMGVKFKGPQMKKRRRKGDD